MLLTVISHLEDNAYGVTIMATAGEPTPERGGRRKVYYTLTEKAKAALEKTKEFHRTLWDWIPD